MKKWFVLLLTVALLAASVLPAMAAEGPRGGGGEGNGGGSGNGSGNGNGRGTFALVGTVAGLDTVNHTVTVTVLGGNKLAQPFIGQKVTLQTTAQTRYQLRNDDGTCMSIAFTGLSVGQSVSSNGSLTNNVWTATRVTVGAQLIGLP